MERFGKAVRNPACDAMLSYARTQVGSGWTYGLHEALDQIGAVLGPVLAAGVLYLRQNDYRFAFGVLLLPALIFLGLAVTGRFLYPRPADLEVKRWEIGSRGLTRAYWLYMAAVGLIGLGFAGGRGERPIDQFYEEGRPEPGGGSTPHKTLFPEKPGQT